MPRRGTESQLFAGRYQLEQELGHGGFGTVHRAWDTQAQRRVALKLVDKRSLELAGGMHRFHREASVLMRLTHPNVVRAYDAGESEGTPYLVLELLEGVSLEVALRTRGALPPEKVAGITRDLLGALAEAHALGVVHRDVKPANVFLTSTGGQEAARLLDFGVAKADSLDAAQTAMGATLGTAAYMAPEQITGGTIQPATDLFAVGLLMAEMIVGRRIYGGSSGLAILVAKANGMPVDLPAAVRESAFGPMIARAVQIDPERRFGSAQEMRAILDRAEGVRVSTAPRASFASTPPRASFSSAPPRDSPLPLTPLEELPTQMAPRRATEEVALAETAPQPRLRTESPARAYVPASSDAAPSAMAAPGPTRIAEIGAAETATFEPLPVVSPPARRSRAGLIAIAIGLVIAITAGVISTLFIFPTKKKPRTAKTEIDAEKPLVLEEGKIHIILDGKSRLDGLSGPPGEAHDCPDLENLCADDLEARLRTLGTLTVNQRGERISSWTIAFPAAEKSKEVLLFEFPTTERTRDATERFRVNYLFLVASKRVITVPDRSTLESVQRAVCHL